MVTPMARFASLEQQPAANESTNMGLLVPAKPQAPPMTVSTAGPRQLLFVEPIFAL
jgi:hypothetical protein